MLIDGKKALKAREFRFYFKYQIIDLQLITSYHSHERFAERRRFLGMFFSPLKEAVRRNITRLPPDFMFEMSKEEFENWRSHFATSNFEGDKMGWRHAPFCFTEQGVAMLSSVLNSQAAIDVNIQIIRVFTKMRESLLTHKDILIKLEQIEKELISQDTKIKQSEGYIQIIFKALKELINPPKVPRPRIGFKRNDEME